MLIVAGTAAQEIDDWPLPTDIHHWSWIDYETYLFEHLSAFGRDLAAHLQSIYAKRGTPERLFTTLVSDLRETCPVNAVAHLLRHFWHEPVYRYVVNFSSVTDNGASPPPPDDVGDVTQHRGDVVRASFRYSYHSIDMYHFFSSTGAATGWLTARGDVSAEQRQQFTDVMRQTVFEFARTGELSGWQLYPATKLMSSQISSVSSNSSYHHEQCELWRVNGMYPRYAWMN